MSVRRKRGGSEERGASRDACAFVCVGECAFVSMRG